MKVVYPDVVELEKDDQIQLLVPASLGRTCVYLSVSNAGKLEITGGSSIIEETIVVEENAGGEKVG